MLVFIIEIIGTVAFASSGAMVGIRKKMDIFGVIVMAVMTAVGGGIIRDLVLGIHPPNTFKDPIYVEYSVATAVILFVIFYIRKHLRQKREISRSLLNFFRDSSIREQTPQYSAYSS